jgi:two-component system, response regulator PdtaR
MHTTRPLDVMIVEDEGVLAMDLEYLLEQAGHRVAGWATCLDEARELSTQIEPDLVLVDLHLTDGVTGLDVAELMRRAGPAAVVFMTANPRLIPEDFLGAIGVLAKPYTSAGVLAALRFIQQGIFDPPPTLKQPVGLTLAPAYRQSWAY